MEKSDVDEWTICKACKKRIKAKSIITHLSRLEKCKNVYGSEFDDLKAKRDLQRKEYLDEYKKDYNRTNSNKIKKKQAKCDSEKKKVRLQNEKDFIQVIKVSQDYAKNHKNVLNPDDTSPGIYYALNYF